MHGTQNIKMVLLRSLSLILGCRMCIWRYKSGNNGQPAEASIVVHNTHNHNHWRHISVQSQLSSKLTPTEYTQSYKPSDLKAK